MTCLLSVKVTLHAAKAGSFPSMVWGIIHHCQIKYWRKKGTNSGDDHRQISGATLLFAIYKATNTSLQNGRKTQS